MSRLRRFFSVAGGWPERAALLLAAPGVPAEGWAPREPLPVAAPVVGGRADAGVAPASCGRQLGTKPWRSPPAPRRCPHPAGASAVPQRSGGAVTGLTARPEQGNVPRVAPSCDDLPWERMEGTQMDFLHQREPVSQGPARCHRVLWGCSRGRWRFKCSPPAWPMAAATGQHPAASTATVGAVLPPLPQRGPWERAPSSSWHTGPPGFRCPLRKCRAWGGGVGVQGGFQSPALALGAPTSAPTPQPARGEVVGVPRWGGGTAG